jgi:hypothetical protein
MSIDLDDLRIFSLMNESVNHADDEAGNQFVIYAGYVFDYATFRSLFMDTMFRSTLYEIEYERPEVSELLRKMNQHDELMQKIPNGVVCAYLALTLKNKLIKLTPTEIENLAARIPPNKRIV